MTRYFATVFALAFSVGVLGCDPAATALPTPTVDTLAIAPSPSAGITGQCHKKHKTKEACNAAAGCSWLVSNGRGYCLEDDDSHPPPY